LRRTLLILSAVSVALAVAPLATAGKPTQETITGPDDSVVTGECAFPVLMHIEGVGIITTFTDRKGNVVRQNFHFPNNKTVFTNLDTGESLTVATTGPAFFRLDPDGSSSFEITGISPWVGHPVTGAGGIFLIEGRLFVTFDAGGNRTSIDFDGNVVDVCARLAS
jgi:hypothetical protein